MKNIIDFIMSQINNLIPFVFVLQFQKGVRYRMGKFNKVLEPGPHWKIPYLETVLKDSIVDTTILLPVQSVITEDRMEVVVSATVGYMVKDIAVFYNNVYDTRSALSDKTMVVIRDTIAANSFDTIISDPVTFNLWLKKLAQKDVKKYGIHVNFVSLVNFTKARSYRLFNETIKLEQ
jgi:regulator of protease activity HflC (stomatin/prohibitin superfamily)